MRKTLLLSTFVLAGFASGAYADLVKANWATVAPLPLTTETVTNVTPFDPSLFKLVDGQFGLDVTGVGPTNGVYVVDFFYNDQGPGRAPFAASPRGETEFNIYTGANQANVRVTALEYFNEAAGYASGSGTATGIPGSTLLVPGRNRFRPTGFALVNSFNVGTYDSVRVTFVFNTGTAADRLQIDMIANPEPGTIALFGLGALGLGAMVRRRRNAAKTPVKS
jgi:hypothetical protein